MLDGKPTNISENDIQRANTIAILLEEWGLLKVLDYDRVESNMAPIHQIKILSYKEKDDYELVQKYSIGSRGKHEKIKRGS